MGGYPLDVYELLVVIDVIAAGYSFLDLNQKYYGNIVALGFSALLSFYLALSSVSGSIIINYASSTVTGGIDKLQDPGIMWLFILIGIFQSLYTLYLTYDAYSEYISELKLKGEYDDGDY